MLFEGFRSHDVEVQPGITIRARTGGQGPALLLLHGHPQTHAMWHKVAGELAKHYSVVCCDLRGYGDSSRPPEGERSASYSKRVMAADMVAVMAHFGHDRFLLGAHDRGARVAHRLAADHAGKVEKMLLLDIAPTLDMYRNTNEAFARAYWHWFFLIQPAPLPERLIEASPSDYLRDLMGRRHAGLSAFDPEALAEYQRCIALPGSATAMCADYRASAGIDLEHDEADRVAGKRLAIPVRVLWGSQGVVGKVFDVLALWRNVADDVSGKALDCGHYIAEEAPQELLSEMLDHFGTR